MSELIFIKSSINTHTLPKLQERITRNNEPRTFTYLTRFLYYHTYTLPSFTPSLRTGPIQKYWITMKLCFVHFGYPPPQTSNRHHRSILSLMVAWLVRRSQLIKTGALKQEPLPSQSFPLSALDVGRGINAHMHANEEGISRPAAPWQEETWDVTLPWHIWKWITPWGLPQLATFYFKHAGRVFRTSTQFHRRRRAFFPSSSDGTFKFITNFQRASLMAKL